LKRLIEESKELTRVVIQKMSEHKIYRPKWLEELEVEINKELKKRFPKKDFSISELSIEFNVAKVFDETQGKRLVLTDKWIATYDTKFRDSTAEEEKQAYNLVGRKISQGFKEKGIYGDVS
jgi:hypothetical protein